MSACEQTQGQSVYQHGISVNEYLTDLLSYLRTNKSSKTWRLPDWIDQYNNQLLCCLLPDEILSQYALFHDCGKPYCLTIDAEGRRHFHDHAKKSYETWMQAQHEAQDQAQHAQIGQLILHDMDIHTIKAEQLEEFARKPEAISLLLTGLAEIHSNAALFGGIDSTSFKIKWKQIDKRGRAICKLLFGEAK